jgi:hypothetical protein
MKDVLEVKDVIALLREHAERAGGQAPWSRKMGLDKTTVNRVLAGRKKLPLSIIDALNLRTVYVANNRRRSNDQKK